MFVSETLVTGGISHRVAIEVSYQRGSSKEGGREGWKVRKLTEYKRGRRGRLLDGRLGMPKGMVYIHITIQNIYPLKLFVFDLPTPIGSLPTVCTHGSARLGFFKIKACGRDDDDWVCTKSTSCNIVRASSLDYHGVVHPSAADSILSMRRGHLYQNTSTVLTHFHPCQLQFSVFLLLHNTRKVIFKKKNHELPQTQC